MVGYPMRLSDPLAPMLPGYSLGKGVNTPCWFAPTGPPDQAAPPGDVASAKTGQSVDGLPRKKVPKKDTPKGIQQNSRAYAIYAPMDRGWTKPTVDDFIAGGPIRIATPKAGIPTMFPFGVRAIADLVGGLGIMNAGQITATVVPPDRYWRARTTPVKASNTLRLPNLTPIKTSWGFGIPGLSFGS